MTYLSSLLPIKQPSYHLAIKNLFSNFISHTVNGTINANLRNSPSLSVFKKGLLAFIRSKECSIRIDPYRLKLLTRLRVNVSHLREHKFRHNFLNTLNPLCSCILETESTVYLLPCPFYANIRKKLLANINNTIGLSNYKSIHLLLYGNEAYSIEVNVSILKYTIIFLKSSERFDMALI